ncbi:MAG: hypothetical protein QOE93_1953 [Actinomycetota bacterium]|jgi:uncharacterized glyoxalase superfamily protein PhnB|nr:hypothetical protein [Actinomycetota bacterium]
MPDPFETLRTPVVPTRPDAEFAARLRARLGDALTLPEGVDVTTTLEALDAPSATTAGPAPQMAAPRMALTPYLAVADARAALDWYADVFGARLRGQPIEMPDGRIGHAELDFGGSLVMLADEFPDIGHTAPLPGAGASVTLHLETAEIDSLVARAADEGATLARPPEDSPYGRNAVVVDPFGHRWLLSTPAPAPAAARPRQGDVGHLMFEVADVERAEAFWSAVLGWTFAPAERPGGRRVLDDVKPPRSFWGGRAESNAVITWTVDDVVAAAEHVRALGGTATEPVEMPYGKRSDCTDDQGMAFFLWQPPPGAAGPSSREPDLAYLTLNVVDSARFRSFFGRLLGWTFTPGRVADGWNVEGPVPMTGLAGGAERASGVPMYRVDDVHAAVERVRAAGGTATAVERRPYGLTSDCTDDQGTPFYLGQLP